ncbi:MAG: glycosyltransferase family 2 protein [Pleurocapsa sp.]
MAKPQVTIIVVPRERFSYSRESLESIYANTQVPFALIYVDGNSPKHIQAYLLAQSQLQNFKLIRSEHYLSPNQARNIGLAAVDTKYVVFLDNDVYVEPGWLEKLIDCAEATDAAAVCPLVCLGKKPLSKQKYNTICLAGGEAQIYLEIKKATACRKVHYQYYFANCLLVEVPEGLQRRECELAKFHTLLVRTDIFAAIGQLDEKLLSIQEDIDFCLAIIQARKKIYCEPNSVVTYVPAQNLTLSDLAYFELRWSDAWELSSLKHFNQKWDLSEQSGAFSANYPLGYHRHQALLRPVVKQLSFGGYAAWLERLLAAGERKINRYISDRYKYN